MTEDQLGNFQVVKGVFRLIYPLLHLDIGIGSRLCMSQLVINRARSPLMLEYLD